MRRRFGGWSWVRRGILGLGALGMALGPPPLYGQEVRFDPKAMTQRLAAIEERDPYHLRDLVRNGRPTLIAFIDHLCHICLRSVEPLEELRRRFSGRADIVVVDPSRITAAHSWAKDRYRVWFVPKFVLLNKRGDVAREYFGLTPARRLASDLTALLAR